jgi:excisionase family DNA binding protein
MTGLLSRNEAAKYLGCHVATLDRLCQAPGGPKIVAIGKRRMVPRAGLDHWIRREAR